MELCTQKLIPALNIVVIIITSGVQQLFVKKKSLFRGCNFVPGLTIASAGGHNLFIVAWSTIIIPYPHTKHMWHFQLLFFLVFSSFFFFSLIKKKNIFFETPGYNIYVHNPILNFGKSSRTKSNAHTLHFYIACLVFFIVSILIIYFFRKKEGEVSRVREARTPYPNGNLY